MLIEEKYFGQDKNYLLKTVQAFSKESLLNSWVDQVFITYNQLHNPMGLQDDFIIQLSQEMPQARELLDENYNILAAIYRLKFGDNQLEFQWDGRTHMEYYDAEWKAQFREWSRSITAIKEFYRPIVKYATQKQDVNSDFLKMSMRRSMLNFFNIKLRSNYLVSLSA